MGAEFGGTRPGYYPDGVLVEGGVVPEGICGWRFEGVHDLLDGGHEFGAANWMPVRSISWLRLSTGVVEIDGEFVGDGGPGQLLSLTFGRQRQIRQGITQ
jgi:hypothetical protein